MKQYYYVDGNNQQQGPIDAAQLPAFGVTTKTLVWCEGMANWQAAGEIPELASFFAAKQPEIPAQPQMQPGTPAQPQMQPGTPAQPQMQPQAQPQVQPQTMNINNFQQTQQPMNTQPPFGQLLSLGYLSYSSLLSAFRCGFYHLFRKGWFTLCTR